MKKLQIKIIYYENEKAVARHEIEEHTDKSSIKVFTEMINHAVNHMPEDLEKVIKE